MFSRTLSSWGRLLGLRRATTTVEEERRQWGRVPCDIETTCQPALQPGARPLPARVHNISRGGIGLIVGRALPPGELLSVTVPASNEDTSEVLACVVRCDEVEPGQWELGCTFAAQLTDDDLQRFGARRERALPPDQRVWVRYDCHARACYQIVRGSEERAPAAAKVVNISAGGIALQVEEALSLGDLLSIDLSRDDRPVLTTLASVVRSSLSNTGERLVGCNFIRELPEGQVEALR